MSKIRKTVTLSVSAKCRQCKGRGWIRLVLVSGGDTVKLLCVCVELSHD